MLIGEPDAGRPDVVERDHAQAVDAVDSARTSRAQSHVRQNGLAQRVATNAKFTRSTPSSKHVHDQHVPDREDQQHDAGDAHEQPGPELEAADRTVAAAAVARCRRAGRCAPRRGSVEDGHQSVSSRMMSAAHDPVIGIIDSHEQDDRGDRPIDADVLASGRGRSRSAGS